VAQSNLLVLTLLRRRLLVRVCQFWPVLRRHDSAGGLRSGRVAQKIWTSKNRKTARHQQSTLQERSAYLCHTRHSIRYTCIYKPHRQNRKLHTQTGAIGQSLKPGQSHKVFTITTTHLGCTPIKLAWPSTYEGFNSPVLLVTRPQRAGMPNGNRSRGRLQCG